MAVITGTEENDSKKGTKTADTLQGLAGNDTLLGMEGNDRLEGDEGNDSLNGGAGNDTLLGGAGDDEYVVDSAGDDLSEDEDEGTDTVYSSVSFTLGEHFENLILTTKKALSGTGNELNNSLTANGGRNTLTGGEGNDVYIVKNENDNVIEDEDEGDDTIRATITFTLADNVETLILEERTKGQKKLDPSINAYGNDDDNVLTGNAENNILDGKGGADTMSGLGGSDTYFVDDADDVINESANQGTDTVKSTISYTLGDNLEKLTLLGSDSINATGNALKNTLMGNSGNNVLNGGAEADVMKGLAGNDTYYVDNTKDTVTETKNAGTDTVISSISFTLGEHFEHLQLAGSGNINGTGNSVANTIQGNSGNNKLNGSGGADTMIGGDGDDTYVIDNVGDVVVEEENEGNDTIEVSRNYTLGDHFENLELKGGSNLVGTGNALNNSLKGNNGKNTLNGGEGDDTMDGGNGDDVYIVDSSDDVVAETNTKGGTDRVESSVSYTLGTNIERLTLTGDGDIHGTGNTLANLILGNSGENNLDGGAGNDTLNGGEGNDTYVFSGNFGKDSILDASGTDTLNMQDVTTNLTINLTAGTGHEVFASSNNTVNWTGNIIEWVLGGEGDDTITGSTANNYLAGGDGNDSIEGGAGADTLVGGDGNDTLKGGLGEDTYIINSHSVTIVELFGESEGLWDTVYSSVSYGLDENVESLVLTGDEDLEGVGNNASNNLVGNAGDNSLYGGSGNDSLAGGEGADQLFGGEGDDTYYVDADDTIVENADEGNDTIEADFSFSMAEIDNVENLLLTGEENISGTGNTRSNSIIGNNGNNTLSGGGGGTDTLIGGLGNDTYVLSDEERDITIEDSEGTDTIDMSGAEAAVQIDLSEGTVTALVPADSAEFEITEVNNAGSQYPQAVRLTDNTIVVSWHDYENSQICAQRYSEEGAALGAQVVIDKIGGNVALHGANIAALENGGYAVAWVEKGIDDAVYVQRFEADGTPVESAQQANTSTTAGTPFVWSSRPYITGLSNGGYAVIWWYGDDEFNGQDLETYGRVYDGDGDPVTGSDFRLNTNVTNHQAPYSIAGFSDGGFVAVWASSQDSGQSSNIYFKIFDNEGEQVVAEARANTYTPEAQTYASVAALTGGGFVIVWASIRQEGSDKGWDIYGQRFSDVGVAQGSEFHINTGSDGDQGDYGLNVAALTNGGFVVTWTDEFEIKARIYDDEGNAESAEIDANTITDGTQWYPTAVGTTDGGFLLTWMSDGDIVGRAFDSEGNAEATLSSVSVATFDTEETEIENAYGGNGSDTLTGNDEDNLLDGGAEGDTLSGGGGDDTLMGGSGEDTYTGFTGTFGNDVIDDSSDGGVLALPNFDLADVQSWSAEDSDEDDFVDRLVITFGEDQSITIENYFNNTSADDDASAAGSGYLYIQFNDDLDVDFAQVQSLVS